MLHWRNTVCTSAWGCSCLPPSLINKQAFWVRNKNFFAISVSTWACLHHKHVWTIRPFFEMRKPFEVCVWSETLLSYNPALHRQMLLPVVLGPLRCFLPLLVMNFSQVIPDFLSVAGSYCSVFHEWVHVFTWLSHFDLFFFFVARFSCSRVVKQTYMNGCVKFQF